MGDVGYELNDFLKDGPSGKPKPPGWTPGWEEGLSSRAGLDTSWWDPNGGEWRWHAPDKWHPEGHWDHNPWTDWNSPWEVVPHH